MAGPPTSGFATISWHFSGAAILSGSAVTTCGCVFGANPGDIAAAAQDLWEDLRPGLANALTCAEIRIKVGPVATGPTFVYGVNTAGGGSVNAVSSQVAFLVDKRIADISGRYAGRFYWPGLAEESVNTGGQIVTAFRLGLQSHFDNFFGALQALDCLPQVFSAASSDPRTVDSFRVQGTVATQRRRLRR